MFQTLTALLVAVAVLAPTIGNAQEQDVAERNDVVYAEHDGVKLLGDLYLPKNRTKIPAVVAVHGGAFRAGNRKFYTHWGPYLAKSGYATFSIDYRLLKLGVTTFPEAVYDVRAAVQYLRANAAEFNIDPERIGMIGDSAGAYLSAMVALAADEPVFPRRYETDRQASASPAVKAVVGFYGVYDLPAQWAHDVGTRPLDNITERFLGAAPYVNRRLYFDASPISYAVVSKAQRTSFYLVQGTADDIVDANQTEDFSLALKQAGFYIRSQSVVGAGHFFATDPIDESSFAGFIAPRLLRFLGDRL